MQLRLHVQSIQVNNTNKNIKVNKDTHQSLKSTRQVKNNRQVLTWSCRIGSVTLNASDSLISSYFWTVNATSSSVTSSWRTSRCYLTCVPWLYPPLWAYSCCDCVTPSYGPLPHHPPPLPMTSPCCPWLAGTWRSCGLSVCLCRRTSWSHSHRCHLPSSRFPSGPAPGGYLQGRPPSVVFYQRSGIGSETESGSVGCSAHHRCPPHPAAHHSPLQNLKTSVRRKRCLNSQYQSNAKNPKWPVST